MCQTFSDGLKTSSLQYQAKNSPMNWLYKFSLSEENRYLVSNYDQNSLKALMGAPSEALELVLGSSSPDRVKPMAEFWTWGLPCTETSSSNLVTTQYKLQH